MSLRTHQKIHILEHVEEQFVSTILDAFAAPTDLTRDLRRDLRLLFLRRGLDALLGDEGLQNASVGVLRVSEVEDLCGAKKNYRYG